MNPVGQVGLYVRTIRHLRPAQLAHRLRLRSQRLALHTFPGPLAARLRRPLPAQAGWPPGFVPLDGRLAASCPDAEANAQGRFRFLNEERNLGDPPDWQHRHAAQLWRYHLHYFEWAWSFVDHPDRSWASAEFRRLWRSWRKASTFGRWDAWSPYVASLRAWALCGLFAPLVAGTDDEADFVADIALHAGFVRANLELDVGGNHLVKNLKALVGLGVFLHDERLLRTGLGHLSRQLKVQVLADGGHFERSPSYHCQVLADLIDVSRLLSTAGHPGRDGLEQAIESMRRWLGAMLMPDGALPLFNDCVAVPSDRLSLLGPVAPAPDPLLVLQPSGYVVMDDGHGLHLVADVGPPCPPELPAHAQADCLSFVLSADGQQVVVDTGTSTYEPGDRRQYERSTRAHNTVEVDGLDQTEVWAAFRAGRRASPRLELAEHHDGAVVVTASHDGYERLAGHPRPRRTWNLAADTVQITDEVMGEARHDPKASIFLAPGLTCEPVSESELRVGPVRISYEGGEVSVDDVDVASHFGRLEHTQRVVLTARGPLPRRFITTITRLGDA